MTFAAEELIKKARSMGADFRFDGDAVVVRAPRPLPGELVGKRRDDERERRRGGGVWAEGSIGV